MGCNFYLVYNEIVDVECHCCGHVKQEKRKRHLGKSFGGWCYSLHVYPEEGLHDFVSICQEVGVCLGDGGYIEDEYGDEWTEDAWVADVEIRYRSLPISEESVIKQGYKSLQDFLDRNNAIIDPNNLLRHKIDGRYCIGHGGSTYDYLVGDFS